MGTSLNKTFQILSLVQTDDHNEYVTDEVKIVQKYLCQLNREILIDENQGGCICK